MSEINGEGDRSAETNRDEGPPTVSASVVRELADMFRGLGDRSRLQILFLLARHGEMNVTTIGNEIGQSQPAVSHHLSQLKNVGLIDCRRHGKFNYYRLDTDGLTPMVLRLFPGPDTIPVLRFAGLEIAFKQPP